MKVRKLLKLRSLPLALSLMALPLMTLCFGAPLQAQSVWLNHVTVLDTRLLSKKPDQALLLQDGVIARQIPAAELAAELKNSKNSTVPVLDLRDKFVLPGLIDAHVHHATEPEGGDARPQTLARLATLLKGGVTTVRDMGGDVRVLAGLKRDAELDLIDSPDIYYSVILGGPEFFADPRTVASARGRMPGQTDWMKAVDATTTDTALEQLMQRALGTGASGIKIYAKVPKDLMQRVSDAAKRAGLQVWAHAYVGPATPSDAVQAGVQVISHAPDLAATVIGSYENWRRKDQPISDEVKKASFAATAYQPLLQQMKQQGTLLDATLTVFQQLQQRNQNAATIYQHGLMLTRQAHQYGIPIVAGTDFLADKAGVDYPLLHQELQLLTEQAGLSPFAALQAATWHAALALGISDSTGSIAVGKKANLLVLNQDPTLNIKHSLDIAHVIKNGQLVRRGDDSKLPFSSARAVNGVLYLSGQLGNLPGTMLLSGPDLQSQMHQTMRNIGAVLRQHGLGYQQLFKCTLMLADINDWPAANQVYLQYVKAPLPARSAFAASGLALGAKAEVECLASLTP